MGTVVNLARYRKAKERAERAKKAASNKLRHGRTAKERAAVAADKARAAKKLAGLHLVKSDRDPE